MMAQDTDINSVGLATDTICEFLKAAMQCINTLIIPAAEASRPPKSQLCSSR